MPAYGWLFINAQSAYVLDMLLVTLNTKRSAFLPCWYQITFFVTMSAPANGGQSAQADYFNLAPTNSVSRPVTVLCLDTSRCRACLFPIERKKEDVLAGNWFPSYVLL